MPSPAIVLIILIPKGRFCRLGWTICCPCTGACLHMIVASINHQRVINHDWGVVYSAFFKLIWLILPVYSFIFVFLTLRTIHIHTNACMHSLGQYLYINKLWAYMCTCFGVCCCISACLYLYFMYVCVCVYFCMYGILYGCNVCTYACMHVSLYVIYVSYAMYSMYARYGVHTMYVIFECAVINVMCAYCNAV